MNGETLKTQLLKIEPTLVEVARKLDMSKQNLDAKLSTADIKTGFIEQLAALYDKPIGFFYGEQNGVEITEVERSFNSNADEIIKELTSIIKSQEARIKAVERWISSIEIAEEKPRPPHKNIRGKEYFAQEK